MLLLGVYPLRRGFAYTLFEGETPIDWGIKERRGARRSSDLLTMVRETLERFRPDVLVLQDGRTVCSRRPVRVRRLHAGMAVVAEGLSVPVVRISREEVRKSFARYGAFSKQEIAETIVKHVPGLSVKLPPRRRPWMTEDARLGLFEAAAMILVHRERIIQE